MFCGAILRNSDVIMRLALVCGGFVGLALSGFGTG
jgi:hypothetical protein